MVHHDPGSDPMLSLQPAVRLISKRLLEQHALHEPLFSVGLSK